MGKSACGDFERTLVADEVPTISSDVCGERGVIGVTISQISRHKWCLAVLVEGAAAAEHLYCYLLE